MARLLDGKALSRKLNKAIRAQVPDLPRPPGLAVVLVGDDPASQVYVRRKGQVAERLGFVHRQLTLPATASQDQVREAVAGLDADPTIDGLLVQLPLPPGLDPWQVLPAMRPVKDVDGLLPQNAGLLVQGRQGMVPCTPLGVMRLLQHAQVPLAGLRAVVLGRSVLVGQPMAALLQRANCTVTVCHSRTKDLPERVGEADVLVAALGQPQFVQGGWIKPGAVVVDVGIHRLPSGGLVGDVAFEAAAARASAITPVPGGVGPMTIAMLMENTYRAACLAQGLEPVIDGSG